MSNPIEKLVLQFLDTAAALERDLDRALANTRGIRFSEYRLLMELSHAGPNGCPRIDLANAVGLTASAITRALRPLEKLGYVETQKSQRDARQSLACVTAAGLSLLEDAQGMMTDVLNQLPLSDVSPSKRTEFQRRLVDLRRTS